MYKSCQKQQGIFSCSIIFQYLMPFPYPLFGTYEPSGQKCCLEILTPHWLQRQNEVDAPQWSFKTWDLYFSWYTFSFENLIDMQRLKDVLYLLKV